MNSFWILLLLLDDMRESSWHVKIRSRKLLMSRMLAIELFEKSICSDEKSKDVVR